jgi:hypothetical protein
VRVYKVYAILLVRYLHLLASPSKLVSRRLPTVAV